MKRAYYQRRMALNIDNSFGPFKKITDFSAGTFIQSDEQQIKKYVSIFPDLYDELEYTKIDFENLKFHMTGKRKITPLVPSDENNYKRLEVKFSFKGESNAQTGWGSSNPLLNLEESRPYVIRDMLKKQD